MLNTLTSDDPKPSPFPRHAIKVYEEPRLREQDFGNFQPSSSEMSRMWRERAEYGHFFYRIPNGESAADAYDRVSGFNESLWRSFGEEDFASVSVLVTHGLMARVFLMKWYHFSVEYFEDLRNIEHCEFVIMKLDPEKGKYVLQNHLRTWSELKREKERGRRQMEGRRMSVTAGSPTIPVRKKWEGCQESEETWRQRQKRQNTADLFMDEQLGERVNEALKKNKAQESSRARGRESDSVAEVDERTDGVKIPTEAKSAQGRVVDPTRLHILKAGRDFGGSRSGATSPDGAGTEDMEDVAKEHMKLLPIRSSMSLALNGELSGNGGDRARADALGDQSDAEEDEEEVMDDIEKMQVAETNVHASVR